MSEILASTSLQRSAEAFCYFLAGRKSKQILLCQCTHVSIDKNCGATPSAFTQLLAVKVAKDQSKYAIFIR